MQTREDAVEDAGVGAPRTGLAGGMGQAAMTALAALAGCVLLIAAGATMSMCWALHPLLTLVAAVAVARIAIRIYGLVFRPSGTR